MGEGFLVVDDGVGVGTAAGDDPLWRDASVIDEATGGTMYCEVTRAVEVTMGLGFLSEKAL
jgi:hypothetical protein